MNLFERIFGEKKSSADCAKDRLKIMLAHERASVNFPHMEEMKQEIIAVIKKYANVKDVNIKSEKNQNVDMLELEIVLGKHGS